MSVDDIPQQPTENHPPIIVNSNKVQTAQRAQAYWSKVNQRMGRGVQESNIGKNIINQQQEPSLFNNGIKDYNPMEGTYRPTYPRGNQNRPNKYRRY